MVELNASYVYLDYAATAPLCEEAAAALAAFEQPGRVNICTNANANSLHSPGRAAFEAMEQARKRVASALGAQRSSEIIFTSGATEADNTALLGIARAAAQEKGRGKKQFVPQLITTAIEHEAVLQPAHALERQGFSVTYVKPNRQGVVEPQALEAALTENTVLVSVQAANSELGSVQPVAELCSLAHNAGALFHTDAVQAAGKMSIDLRALGVDAASFSAHKVGGPKGVGALYVKARTPYVPFMLGGGQESGKRSGTQNVPGMLAFAAALEASVALQEQESVRLRALRTLLYERMTAVPGVTATVDVLPDSAQFLPNIAHVLVDGVESETLILRLDALGFGVSGGSACSSSSLEPSHVLTACGVAPQAALGALRVSFGRYTTQDDIEAFCEAFATVVSQVRG